MRRTISGMIGAGSLAHNRRDFIAENVDPDRVHLNICYQNENLKEVYAVQQDIQEQKALEEKRQVEQMPKGSIHERLALGARKSEMENQQRKKNKSKNRGMER